MASYPPEQQQHESNQDQLIKCVLLLQHYKLSPVLFFPSDALDDGLQQTLLVSLFLHGRLDAITCSHDLIAPVDEEAIFHFSTAEKKNGS